MQMQAVEEDRRRLADQLSARETAGARLMKDQLADLQAQLAAKDVQLQQARSKVAGWARTLCSTVGFVVMPRN